MTLSHINRALSPLQKGKTDKYIRQRRFGFPVYISTENLAWGHLFLANDSIFILRMYTKGHNPESVIIYFYYTAALYHSNFTPGQTILLLWVPEKFPSRAFRAAKKYVPINYLDLVQYTRTKFGCTKYKYNDREYHYCYKLCLKTFVLIIMRISHVEPIRC